MYKKNQIKKSIKHFKALHENILPFSSPVLDNYAMYNLGYIEYESNGSPIMLDLCDEDSEFFFNSMLAKILICLKALKISKNNFH